MKVLVTGANGLLGSNIIRELEKRGLEARAMVRPNARLLSLKGCKPEYFFGDISKYEDLEAATRDCDYIIHTAAVTRQTLPGLKDYLKVNLGGTQNVIDAALKNKIRKLIYVSSTNSIGYGNKENPGTEEKPAMKPYTESYYAMSKFMAEKEVLEAVEKKGLNALILNPSFMIGPNDSKPSSGSLLLIGYRNRMVFLTSGGRNFVPVEDVATAACNALTMGKKGEKYLLTNANLTYKEFYDIVDDITGFKRIKIMLPSFLVKGVGMLGSLASKSGRDVLLNYNNAKILTVRNFYSADKAVTELGFPQSDIRSAIGKALQWFRDNNYIKR
ncbi:MAG: NAD-dependent epimerase/dehydratase family protein [Bacteroidales bacterium]|jgi:dihydroflavonol-4-reductase|nr:NAD-dependent epimerase/dehydratase family protein [Bacteroidales bacterium]